MFSFVFVAPRLAHQVFFSLEGQTSSQLSFVDVRILFFLRDGRAEPGPFFLFIPCSAFDFELGVGSSSGRSVRVLTVPATRFMSFFFQACRRELTFPSYSIFSFCWF